MARPDKASNGTGAEDVSEVLVCYALGVYETQSNPKLPE
jgi:hypothetical protein